MTKHWTRYQPSAKTASATRWSAPAVWNLATLIVPALVACSTTSDSGLSGDGQEGEAAAEPLTAVAMTGVATFEQRSQLPACSLYSLGEVYYVKSSKELIYCDGKRLRSIDIDDPSGHWLTQLGTPEECDGVLI